MIRPNEQHHIEAQEESSIPQEIDSNKPNEISFKLNSLKHQALQDNNVWAIIH